jgi:two-component system response regulator HydG
MPVFTSRHVPQAPYTFPESGHAGLLAPGDAELTACLHRVIPQDTTLLLTGETGTGKTRLAREIHALSPRGDEPYSIVDCGALSPHLIESEMFGHVQGAFTGADEDRPGRFAAAGRGTLVLDDINSLPLSLQGKLLRAVDDRVFDPVGSDTALPLQARIIAISGVPLTREVAAGRFRADLYYRLNIVALHLPPLRERRAAIALLARQFAAACAARNHSNVRGLSAPALTLLEKYDWPGNIRELHNVVERAVALAPGAEIQPADLPATVRQNPVGCLKIETELWEREGRPNPFTFADCLTLTKSKEQVEILKITEALQKHRNNRLRAAAELGISRMALYKKLHKYGLMRTA